MQFLSFAVSLALTLGIIILFLRISKRRKEPGEAMEKLFFSCGLYATLLIIFLLLNVHVATPFFKWLFSSFLGEYAEAAGEIGGLVLLVLCGKFTSLGYSGLEKWNKSRLCLLYTPERLEELEEKDKLLSCLATGSCILFTALCALQGEFVAAASALSITLGLLWSMLSGFKKPFQQFCKNVRGLSPVFLIAFLAMLMGAIIAVPFSDYLLTALLGIAVGTLLGLFCFWLQCRKEKRSK